MRAGFLSSPSTAAFRYREPPEWTHWTLSDKMNHVSADAQWSFFSACIYTRELMNWRHFGSENTGIQQNSIILVGDFYVLKAALIKYTNFMFGLENFLKPEQHGVSHTQTFTWLNSNTWWKKWSGNNRAYVFHSTYQLLDSWVTRPVDVCVKALSLSHTHTKNHIIFYSLSFGFLHSISISIFNVCCSFDSLYDVEVIK